MSSYSFELALEVRTCNLQNLTLSNENLYISNDLTKQVVKPNQPALSSIVELSVSCLRSDLESVKALALHTFNRC